MTDGPDLDEIIRRVREEARRPEYQVPTAEPLAPLVTTAAASTAPERGSAARATGDDTVFDLLLIDDSDGFIDRAYRRLLGRPADPAGAQYYGDCLARGYGRFFPLAALASSREAGSRPLPGLGLAPILYNGWRVLRRLGLAAPARRTLAAYGGWRQRRVLASERGMRLRARERAALEQRLVALEGPGREAVERLQASVSALEGAQRELASALAASREGSEVRGRALSERIDELRRNQAIFRASLAAARLQRAPVPVGAASGHGANAPGAAADDDPELEQRLDAYYLAFEEIHRGSEAQIRAGQAPYLEALATLPASTAGLPVLDLGCGRGEWLTLLREQGLAARGADLSPLMAAHCREQGLDVSESDAVAMLAACDDESLAAVSAFHLIEHLPFATLFRLLEEAARALAPGGLLILETPNPENVLVGSHTFYHDFSHRNPVTPSALDFLVGYLGLEDRRFLRLNPYPPEASIDEPTLAAERINGHLYGPQDLGMVARKPLPAASAADTGGAP